MSWLDHAQFSESVLKGDGICLWAKSRFKELSLVVNEKVKDGKRSLDRVSSAICSRLLVLLQSCLFKAVRACCLGRLESLQKCRSWCRTGKL